MDPRLPGEKGQSPNTLREAASAPGLEGIPFTVAICTLNRLRYLKPAVTEVLAQLVPFPQGRLLVVDNGSSDGTDAYLHDLREAEEKVLIAREARTGTYFARRRAIQEGQGDYLVFLDDDAVPRPGWLSAMLEELTAPNVGVVGCTIEPLWEVPRPKWLSDRLMREIPVYTIDEDRRSTRFPFYPPSISLGLRLNACARLFAGAERRDDYPLGRKGTAHDRPMDLIAGEDSDLVEIYARNGFDVVFSGRATVMHTVPESRVDPLWYVRKFESEGHLRIRLLRVAGYPVVGRHSIRMLAFLPVFVVLRPLVFLMPAATGVLVRAYHRKCVGAWRELLRGHRPRRLPYLCEEEAGDSSRS